MQSNIKQITEGDYKIFVSTVPSGDKTSDTMFKFLTQYDGAKNPEELERKFEFMLSLKEIDNLIRAVQEAKIQALRREHELVGQNQALV